MIATSTVLPRPAQKNIDYISRFRDLTCGYGYGRAFKARIREIAKSLKRPVLQR